MAYRFAEDRQSPGAYHVWAKVPEGRALFRDDDDRTYFEWLMDRHLSESARVDARHRQFVPLRDEVGLCARNLLTSHFHLVLWQKTAGGIERLMRRVLAIYTRYYNRKYRTEGALFPGPYRSSRIEGRKSFRWRVAYVHANHKRLRLGWRFSTHASLIDEDPPTWLEAEKTLRAFDGHSEYLAYMEKYLARKDLDAELREAELPF